MDDFEYSSVFTSPFSTVPFRIASVSLLFRFESPPYPNVPFRIAAIYDSVPFPIAAVSYCSRSNRTLERPSIVTAPFRITATVSYSSVSNRRRFSLFRFEPAAFSAFSSASNPPPFLTLSFRIAAAISYCCVSNRTLKRFCTVSASFESPPFVVVPFRIEP